MPKRQVSATDEPGEVKFELPSPKEHLFQVVDILEPKDGNPDIVLAKLEVVGGNEEGRSLLSRFTLDDSAKGFFFTRLFLKAIGEPYKGANFAIDTDNWTGKQFYAKIIHKEYNGKMYANIDEFNFDKKVEPALTTSVDDIEWEQ